MKRKLKIAVLMGGKSSEHDISLMSGKEVIKNLDKKKYNVLPLIISKTGNGLEKLLTQRPDLAFIALHGPLGEDGSIQGMLEMLGIPYTGSRVSASAIGMDKVLFRKIMKDAGVLIPKYDVISKADKIFHLKDFPYFIKPVDQGSSVGCSIARNKKELLKSLKLSFRYSDKALVDEYIKGVELTCGVLGGENPTALPVVEIVPKNEFFDYDSKYTESGTEELIPARIDKNVERNVRELSIKVFKTIGAEGFARVDFILKENKLYVLEINTIPGLTPLSLLPKEASRAGICFSKLLDKIISYAKS